MALLFNRFRLTPGLVQCLLLVCTAIDGPLRQVHRAEFHERHHGSRGELKNTPRATVAALEMVDCKRLMATLLPILGGEALPPILSGAPMGGRLSSAKKVFLMSIFAVGFVLKGARQRRRGRELGIPGDLQHAGRQAHAEQ